MKWYSYVVNLLILKTNSRVNKTHQAIAALICRDHCKHNPDFFRQSANLIKQEFAQRLDGEINKSPEQIEKIRAEKPHIEVLIGDLAFLLSENLIEYRHAKKIFHDAWEIDPYAWDLCWYLSGILTGEKLLEETKGGELDGIILAAISKNPKAVADIKDGKEKAAGSILGAIMREHKGINPKEAMGRIVELVLST